MATAREFLLILRLEKQKENETFSYLNRIEKMLVEQGFKAKRADEEDIRRILAVYFEQNVTTERFEEFDGEMDYLKRLIRCGCSCCGFAGTQI